MGYFKKITGLTFVELLLATVMLSVLSVALYGMLSNGIAVWQKVNQETPQIDINLLSKKLDMDLRNCFYFKKIPFTGQENMISFPSVVNIPAIEDGFTQGIAMVIYSFDEQAKAVNRNDIDFNMLNSLKSPQPRVLLSNVEQMSFSYYYFSNDKQQFFWSQSWPPTDTKEEISVYPQAVRVTIVIGTGSATQKRVKTINIPVGGLLR